MGPQIGQPFTQVGLLQSLAAGNFTGCITAAQLKSLGDTGLGTFHAIDGELILLDGTVYQALANGSITVPPEDAGVSFASVTHFRETAAGTLNAAETAVDLGKRLDAILPEPNYFYTILFEGHFPFVTVRSETPQETSARPLGQVMETAQTVHTYRNIEGTIVGQYCPPYMEGFQVCGWHFHFLSKGRTQGGHVLDLAFTGGPVLFSESREFFLRLPQDPLFRAMDLTGDHRAAIEKLERGT